MNYALAIGGYIVCSIVIWILIKSGLEMHKK